MKKNISFSEYKKQSDQLLLKLHPKLKNPLMNLAIERRCGSNYDEVLAAMEYFIEEWADVNNHLMRADNILKAVKTLTDESLLDN